MKKSQKSDCVFISDLFLHKSGGRTQRVGRAREIWGILEQGHFLVSQGTAWGNCSPFSEVTHSVYSVCRMASCDRFEISVERVSANEPMLACMVPMSCVCHLESLESSVVLTGVVQMLRELEKA